MGFVDGLISSLDSNSYDVLELKSMQRYSELI